MIFESRLRGYVAVKATGADSAVLLNRLTAEQVPLWNVTFGAKELSFSLPFSRVEALRRCSAELDCYFIITKKGGLPFFLRDLKKRRVALMLLFFVCGLLAVFSSFVWRVEICCDNREDLALETEQRISAVAAEKGVTPFRRKGNIDKERVACEILAACPDLAWVDLSFHGVTAEIHVAERRKSKDPFAACGHVVATKDGVLRQIFVLRGQKAVEVGDTVKQGDILISGFLAYEEEGRETVFDTTSAKGMVKASVWCEGIAYVSLERVRPLPTGKTAGIVAVTGNGQTFTIWGNEKDPFEDCIVKERELSLFGWKLRRKTYIEATPKKQVLRKKEAKALAERAAGTVAENKVGKNAVIVARDCVELNDVPGAVGVRVTLETEEDIGLFVPADGGTYLRRHRGETECEKE